MKNKRYNSDVTLIIWLSVVVFALVIVLAIFTISYKPSYVQVVNTNYTHPERNRVDEIVDPRIDYYPLDHLIYKVRREQHDRNFTPQDASIMTQQILQAADNHNLPVSIAFIIVHVESDFKSGVYNATGNAYGLCQVTKPCLDEYNMVNGTHYSLERVRWDDKLNLEVGFWYYNRILNHYNNHYQYITEHNDYTQLRDAYIAYNVGVTTFHKIGRDGRNELRRGVYPCNLYGAKKGSRYVPYFRFDNIFSQDSRYFEL